jgi:mannose-6-phosphate isomerase-like protein (cupin superfamily)
MRTISISLGLTIAAAAVWAQQPATATKTYSSAADVAALLAKAKSEHKEGRALVTEPILQLAPYSAKLVYHSSVGGAAIHEHEAELYYVLDGSATLVTGGKLANEKRTDAENLTGTAIEGGNAQAIAKGDFIIVPENTPHWFSVINGYLVVMALHVPRSAGVGSH